MKLSMLKLIGCGFFVFLSSCASFERYPYFDSSMNDHNRAPASLGVPDIADEKIEVKTQQQAEADFLFLKADLESLDGNNTESIELLKSAMSIDTSSPALMQKLAVEYYRKGQITDSIYWVQKSIALDPKNEDMQLLYASMLMTQKAYDKAEDVYLKLIKQNPEQPEPLLYIGALYSEQKKYQKADGYFKRVIFLNTYEPKHLPYYYRAKSILDSEKKELYPSAMKDLEKSFDLKPDFLESIQVYSSMLEQIKNKKAVIAFYVKYQKDRGPISRLAEVLSQHYIEADQYGQAFEQLEILENASEDVIPVKLKMALILIDKKMFDRAALKLEELKFLVPESDKVKFYLAAVYEELKLSQKAILTYQQIQPTSNHYEDSRLRAAMILRSQKNYDQALGVVQEGLKTNKKTIQMFMMQAQLFEDQKLYTQAIDSLLVGDSEFPKNSQINYYIGTLFDLSENKDMMMKHMRLSVVYDDQNHQAMNYMAYSLSELGQNLEEAEKLALNAYKLQSNDPYIADTLGWVYYKKGDYKKSAIYLEKAHEMSPDVGIIAEHLGDVYIKLKKDDKARSAYLKAKQEEKDSDRIKLIESKITAIESIPNKRIPASAPTVYEP